jgi:hypothetical protein
MDYQSGNSKIKSIAINHRSRPTPLVVARLAHQDEALKVSGPGDPLPDWLLEDWPAPKVQARIADLSRRRERAPV